jgi:P27 family predicted phage terminase small subunit
LQCGAEVIALLRGRKRKFCSDRCRLASHRRQGPRRVRRAGVPVEARPAQPGGLASWAVWAREVYVLDRTAEELLRLILEADARYTQARDALEREGLVQLTNDGRATARPEVAVERDTRAAIQRLIAQLGLEGDDENAQATKDNGDTRFPRRVS